MKMELSEKYQLLSELSLDPGWGKFCSGRWVREIIRPGTKIEMVGDLLRVEGFGEISYYRRGKLHREDGPAWERGLKQIWYFEGKMHRIGGPAEIYLGENSYEHWYLKGKLHREDGPASIRKSTWSIGNFNNGEEGYYLYGQHVKDKVNFEYMIANKIDYKQWKKDKFKKYI